MKGNILIGVSASIALYKTCDLVRELTKLGYNVKVSMTRNAEKWISPVIFSALSNNRVYTSDMNQTPLKNNESMPHIEIRENIDLFLVAPATADVIARAAAGFADDIVTATLLSFSGERWVAPSMNPFMYNHPATQKNLEILRSFGYKILDPQNGEAVCGDHGEGKMASIEVILEKINSVFSKST